MKHKVLAAWTRVPRVVRWFIFIYLVIVALQFGYPSDRALPFSRLDGQVVSFQSRADLEKMLLSDYDSAKIRTKIRGVETTVSSGSVGITPNVGAIVPTMTDYPWYWRLLPFSVIYKGIFTEQAVVTTQSGDGFVTYLKARQAECELAPKNAAVVVRDGAAVLDSAKNGESCSEDSLRGQLLAKPLRKNGINEINVMTTPVAPVRSDTDVAPLLERSQNIINQLLEVELAGKVNLVEKSVVAAWLVFTENPSTKQLEVNVDTAAVKVYLATIQKDVYIAPGTTVVTTYDSLETGRSVGASGQGIDMEATATAISKQVLETGGRVVAQLSVLSPNLRYIRSYSNTPAGMQALVNDLASGKSVAISVRRLGDTGVNANGDKQYHPASTYKLFVAFSVLKRIDGGSASWGQAATNGQTFAQCFDNMIINSDNICAEWFGKAMGWSAVEADARSIGASRTKFGASFVSTANDLATFLQKLESNQLGLSESSRGRLLDIMKRQRFRQGIPAGVGVTVADKVGFLEAKLHDAAIVYSPSGAYVLVILSDGSSWAEIASIANQIHAQITR